MNPATSATYLPSRYETLGLLGEGGSGQVFRVLDHKIDRQIALKLVGAAESVWLRREFDTLRQIRHENLIQVFEWATLPTGNSYYTMELIAGTDLGSKLGTPVGQDWLRPILEAVLRGLGHLHSHGEIHGDLKPGNILLGSGGVVKLSDIGMGGDSETTRTSIGTPGYTAPEVLDGGRSTVQSDIYAAGVIAYEALTGKHPFEAITIREVIAGQIKGWVPSLHAQRAEVSADFERAIMRALERDPDLRQGSADEFLAAIGADDQVGEILGGRFADRDGQQRILRDFITSDEPAHPTLLYLVGSRGAGKTALLDEVLAAESQTRVLAFRINEPERDLRLLAKLSPSEDSLAPLSMSDVATNLINNHPNDHVLVIEDPPARGDLVRNVARYIWAEAAERDAPPGIRFLRAVQSAPAALEAFERILELPQFTAAEADSLISGVLGQVEKDASFAERLVGQVGGTPGALIPALLELIDKKLIIRRRGRWKVTHLNDADWTSMYTATSLWKRTWSRLRDPERDVLTSVCLMRDGLGMQELRRLLPTIDLDAACARLQAIACIETRSGRLRPSSRDVARVVLDPENEARKQFLQQQLLASSAVDMSRLDRAFLLLASVSPDPEAIQEGLWLGGELQSRGEYGEAIKAYLRVRDLARNMGNLKGARSAGLMAAEGLRQAGEAADVLNVLVAEEWQGNDDQEANAARARLMGLSYKATGDLNAAREQFLACSFSARQFGDTRLWLQAEAELAEIEWRHGGEPGREAAAKRIGELALSADQESLADEWAALKYQLGASLIMAGKRDEAIPILEAASRLSASDYWHMRIGNASAAAHYYLGEFKRALEDGEQAWRHAQDGGFDSFKPRILATMAAVHYGLGKLREAAEQDQLAAYWGRRIGNLFEYEAGLLAAMADSVSLANYERALNYALEVRAAATGDPHSRHIAKSYELEGLTLTQVGDYAAAESSLDRAREVLVGRGFDDLLPRVQWHWARIDIEQQRFSSAEERLSQACRILEGTRDWEDLPGVKVEMQLLFARAGDNRLNIEELKRVVAEARAREVALVQLRSTLVFAEAAAVYDRLTPEALEVMMDGLRLAERSGAREFAWRLSYWIAYAHRLAGDMHNAAARASSGLRVMREVAVELSPRRRTYYLSTSHARLLLGLA